MSPGNRNAVSRNPTRLNETRLAIMYPICGHAHAVGFSLPSSQVEDLRNRMARYAASKRTADDGITKLDCDLELRLGEITADFLVALEQLGPFGNGNSEPVFLSYGVRLAIAPKVVKDRHLRLTVEDPNDGSRWGGMAWGRRTDWAARAREEGWVQGSLLDLAYRLRRNWHPDFGGWELEVIAIRSSSTNNR